MTHDGGGWTLVMKAVGSDASLAYDQIYWDSTALLNPTDLDPNEDETGSSSKYDAYNRVLGTTLRLEFLTPSAQHPSQRYGLLLRRLLAASQTALRLGPVKIHNGALRMTVLPMEAARIHSSQTTQTVAMRAKHGPHCNGHPKNGPMASPHLNFFPTRNHGSRRCSWTSTVAVAPVC